MPTSKPAIFCLLASLLFISTGCCGNKALTASSNTPVLITETTKLDSVVGKRVQVEGIVSNSKQPYLLGIDVDGHECRDKRGWAEGVLIREIVTPAQVENTARIAARGRFTG